MLPRRISILSQSLRSSLRTRAVQSFAQRWQSTQQQPSYEPPSPPPGQQGVNPHRAFYKSFGLPFLKVFLGALCTYQIIYWSWLKLESLELKREKEAEIKMLEAKVEKILAKPPSRGG